VIQPGKRGISVEPTTLEERERLQCGLVSTLPDQLGEHCVRTADMHLLIVHPEHGGLAKLLTCLLHYTDALGLAEKVAAHEIRLWCELPSTTFDPDLNECVPDDSGAGGGAPEVS
jgi:hypothetical protein